MRLFVLETIRQGIQKFRLIPPDSTLIVAVSGGADSLALLHLLYTLLPYLRCTLHVATLDHGLRGEAGGADAHFVVETAEAWGLSTTIGHADVKALAVREKMGIETAARNARYNFLADVAHQIGASRVAVAHHAGDQAETVLMHVIRGSGAEGLAGMAMQSPMPNHTDLTIIRPLLWVTRQEIESYCREHGLTPREDVTNHDITILRNYIRLETLPHLQKLNPHVERVLGQVAEISRIESDFLDTLLQDWITSTGVTIEPHRIMLNRARFCDLHPALARRLLIWTARRLSPEVDSPDYQHVVDAVEIGSHGKQGAIAWLATGVRLRVDYESLVVEHQEVSLPTGDWPLIEENLDININIPSVTQLPKSDWTLVVSFEGDSMESSVACLHVPDGTSLRLRGRRDGDRFAPLGMGGHRQKLNRWMINRKIPSHLRAHIPLVCLGEDVAAICWDGRWFVAEKYGGNEYNGRIVYFHFKKNS